MIYAGGLLKQKLEYHQHTAGPAKMNLLPSECPHDIVFCISSLTGSPLQFYVDAINSGHVTAYGPGLSHGTVNRLSTFTIVTKDAGEGINTSFSVTFYVMYKQN